VPFAAAADGARLAYQLGGPEAAPPLLLLPGQANSHEWWTRLRVPFDQRFRTISFDYRGTGATECALGEWSTASFAADAAAVLDHLGHAVADVYGTSMGGRVAQMLALDGRVRRLVLACTSPGGPHARERSQQVRRALAQRENRAALLDLMYTPAYAAAHGHESTLLGDPGMSREASRRHLRVSGGHDAYEALPRIAAPTLVLHGSDDRMAPLENAHLLAYRIADARLRITPRGRHGFFEEFAASVNPEILDFLGREPALDPVNAV
jgi:pimeloyl-ACP methyl ester carboxylesterase